MKSPKPARRTAEGGKNPARRVRARKKKELDADPDLDLTASIAAADADFAKLAVEPWSTAELAGLAEADATPVDFAELAALAEQCLARATPDALRRARRTVAYLERRL
jgi:hypothetical protein